MNTILIQQVRIGQRLRKVRPESVEALAASIKELGLLNPILVTPLQHDGQPESAQTYRLIAGHHRLEACKRLGLTDIGANIVTVRDVDQRLAEIDENLCRAELNQLERAEHLVERKSLYETKYPQTRHGGAPGQAGGGKKAKVEKISSFASDTAEKTGKTERGIRQAVRRANNISQDVRDTIREVDAIADNASELDALAGLKVAEQKAAVQAIMDGEARSIREAIRKREGDTTPPKSKATGEQAAKPEPAQEHSDTPTSDEAREWKRKAKEAFTEVLAAKERIRTLNKERSALKARIKELENRPPIPAQPPRLNGFHGALDDIATTVSSDPMSMTPQDLVAIRNHLLKTTTVIEEVMTAMNQPFSQWGE